MDWIYPVFTPPGLGPQAANVYFMFYTRKYLIFTFFTTFSYLQERSAGVRPGAGEIHQRGHLRRLRAAPVPQDQRQQVLPAAGPGLQVLPGLRELQLQGGASNEGSR